MSPHDWKDILGSIHVPDEAKADAPSQDAASRPPRPDKDKSVTLFYERKGRGGRPVTILADFAGIDDGQIEDLASSLKKSLATGGSVRDREILIQGDRRDDLRRILTQRGFRVKG